MTQQNSKKTMKKLSMEEKIEYLKNNFYHEYVVLKHIVDSAVLEDGDFLKEGDSVIKNFDCRDLTLTERYYLKIIKTLIEEGFLVEVYNPSKSELGLFTNQRSGGKSYRRRIVNVSHLELFKAQKSNVIKIFSNRKKL